MASWLQALTSFTATRLLAWSFVLVITIAILLFTLMISKSIHLSKFLRSILRRFLIWGGINILVLCFLWTFLVMPVVGGVSSSSVDIFGFIQVFILIVLNSGFFFDSPCFVNKTSSNLLIPVLLLGSLSGLNFYFVFSQQNSPQTAGSYYSSSDAMQSSIITSLASVLLFVASLRYHRNGSIILPVARPNIFRTYIALLRGAAVKSLKRAPVIGLALVVFRKLLNALIRGVFASAKTPLSCRETTVGGSSSSIISGSLGSVLSSLFSLIGLSQFDYQSCQEVIQESLSVDAQYQHHSSYRVFFHCSILMWLLLTVLEVLYNTMIVFITYPLDFSKLNNENESLFASTSSTGSSNMNTRSGGGIYRPSPISTSAGSLDDDSLLYDALSTGGARLKSNYTWRQPFYISAANNGRGAAYDDRYAVGGAARSTGGPTVVVGGGGTSAVIGGGGGSNSHIPCWLEVVQKQREFSDDFLASVKPSAYGTPVLPFLTDKKASRCEVLARCLALQDLVRIARTNTRRRKRLFASGGKWPEIAFAACSLVDAITIQLQLYVAHGLVEVIDPHLAYAEKTAHAHGDAHTHPATSLPSGAKSTAVLKVHLSSMLLHGGKGADKGPLAQHWNGAVPWAAMEIVKSGRQQREKTYHGTFLKVVLENSLFQPLAPAARALAGLALVDPDPLPSLLAQAAVHAVEALSILLLAALKEDPTGTAQHHAGAVVWSLLALEMALQEHEDLVRRALPISAVDLSRALSPSRVQGEDKDTHQLLQSYFPLRSSNRSNSHSYQKLHRKDIAAVLSPDLRSVSVAAEEALRRLVRGYRDVLVTYSFPKIYAEALQTKIAEL